MVSTVTAEKLSILPTYWVQTSIWLVCPLSIVEKYGLISGLLKLCLLEAQPECPNLTDKLQ